MGLIELGRIRAEDVSAKTATIWERDFVQARFDEKERLNVRAQEERDLVVA